jgi:hypothetical protein
METADMDNLDDKVGRLVSMNISNDNQTVVRRRVMRSVTAVCVIASVILASTSVATAVMTITADADTFADGADISTAFANVTLSSVGTGYYGGLLDGKVYARVPINPLHTSTPDKVFGNNLPGSNGDGNPLEEVWWQNDLSSFRMKAEIIGYAKTVEVDVICNDDDAFGDWGILEVYDAHDNLLYQTTVNTVGRGDVETLAYASSSYNIRYVIISGGEHDTICVDNFRATAVPAPGALLLGGIGIALVGWLRRKNAL